MIVDSTGPLPIFSQWIEALLEHERAIESQPASLRARAFNRARAFSAEAACLPLPRASWLGSHPIILGSATGFGMLVSVALVQLARSSSPTSPALKLPAPTLPSPSAQMLTPSPPVPLRQELDEESAEGATATPPSEHRTDQPNTDTPASDELAMLERAQRLDARGDFLAVLALAAEHERLHPTGRLCEEREVLRLRALIGLKRAHEAQRVVRKFRHDYPHSVLLPTLDEMLAAVL